MTVMPNTSGQIAPRKTSLLEQDARTQKRNAAEARFKFYGLSAIVVGLLMLMIWLCL